MLIFVVPLAAVVAIAVRLNQSSVNAHAQCLHGHQEWRFNGQTRDKAWVCEVYEAER
jgi:hypothetical protein